METTVHDSAPIVWALEHPITFYSICLALFVAAALLWWRLPNNQTRPSVRRSLRTDLSIFYAGSVVSLGIIGSMIQFQSNIQRDQQTQRHALSSENAKRFDSAVKQLREKSDFAALGAIFTLGELSKQDGFYWPSVALINAYLRQETQVPHADSNRAVIVSSLNMLSQRDWRYRDGEPSPLDFSSLSLKGLLFSEPRLWGSNFRFTDLSGAILPGAKMEGTDFHCANFEGANFQESSLYNTTGATELGPKLSSANFRNANLSNVIFKRNEYHFVDVENACFEGATLTGADISGFDLDKVTGLTPEKIQTAKVRPDVPATYSSKPCQSYRDLCSQAQR